MKCGYYSYISERSQVLEESDKDLEDEIEDAGEILELGCLQM
jgi:hypothetical protein